MDYATLADNLLGPGARPFSGFVAPADMQRTTWFQSYFKNHQADLARTIARTIRADHGGYIVELGSFLGDSAITWAAALDQERVNATVVCIDTWTGDVPMWIHKGEMLGHPGANGQPRLYEQFLFNVQASGYSHRILPMRASATVGLAFLEQLVTQHKLKPPPVVFLDAAHE